MLRLYPYVLHCNVTSHTINCQRLPAALPGQSTSSWDFTLISKRNKQILVTMELPRRGGIRGQQSEPKPLRL